MKKYVSSLLIGFIVAGCGGGGGGNGMLPNNNTDDGNNTHTGTKKNTGVGYYVDSAVSGVSYSCGKQNGKTDTQGKFVFETGSGCEFSINNIPFKSVTASKLTDGVTIQEDDVKIARFLLTLDIDGVPENGITISDEVAKIVKKVPVTDADFAALYSALTQNVGNYAGKAVTRAEALAHLHHEVTPPPVTGRWDNVPILAQNSNGNSRLYVTSDADKLYLLLKSDANISSAVFFLDTDNSALTGFKTSSWPNAGFDYRVTSSGLYRLQKDFSGKKVADTQYNIINKSVEIVVDKSDFEYLAENTGIAVFFPGAVPQRVPVSADVANFKDSFFDPNQPDTVPPVITLTGANPLVLHVGDTFVEPGVSATDVIDGSVAVDTDISALDTSKPGFYSVIYTAVDVSGNIGNADRIVEVRGGNVPNSLEVKTLGAFNDSVVINHQTNQVWGNDNRGEDTTRGCYIFGTEVPYAQLADMMKTFCGKSNYAGFTDWRAPTPLELSKFTIRMQKENKTPGMARKGCIRILGVEEDNTTVKAVWTHIMNQPGLIETGNLTPSGGRCVRGPIDHDTGTFSIQEIGADKDKVMVDTSKHLMWVNESVEHKKNACLAIHAGTNEYDTSKTFCSQLNFAGFSDWRDPTSAELSNFIIKTNEAYLLPGYLAPCKALLARDSDGTEKSVSTRFDTTKPIGTVSPLAIPLTSNIGLRCVRDN